MAAERTFWHKGLRVDVWSKSFKWSGMPFTILLGNPPDDDKIRKMIDTAQKPVRRGNHFRPEPRRRSLRERFLLWWYGVGITPPEEVVGTFTGPPVTKEMQLLFAGYGASDVTGIIQLPDGLHVSYSSGAKLRFVPVMDPPR